MMIDQHLNLNENEDEYNIISVSLSIAISVNAFSDVARPVAWFQPNMQATSTGLQFRIKSQMSLYMMKEICGMQPSHYRNMYT